MAEYLADTVITRRRVLRSQDIDYDLIHQEKSTEEDNRKVVERIAQKLKLA